jgi:hypothetical protein
VSDVKKPLKIKAFGCGRALFAFLAGGIPTDAGGISSMENAVADQPLVACIDVCVVPRVDISGKITEHKENKMF